MDERVEAISAELHGVYLATARWLGWSVRPDVDVPYDALSEHAKELDRAFARWHLAALAQVEREYLLEAAKVLAVHEEEVERLTQGWDEARAALIREKVEVERLKATLARVRAALEKSARAYHHEMHVVGTQSGPFETCVSPVCRAARAALEGR